MGTCRWKAPRLWPQGPQAVKKAAVNAPEKDEKAKRLAAALRENLRRRKAQSREQEPSERRDQPK